MLSTGVLSPQVRATLGLPIFLMRWDFIPEFAAYQNWTDSNKISQIKMVWRYH